ncbi:MAG: energy coupling factor transporter S component ThiW [Desulfobacterales bacterium]|nr:energy coupling factor transporter S component ThiW [Desulfobacterales bacterium]
MNNPHIETRRTAYAVVLVAMGVALAPYTSIPVGIARINPTQHFVNVVAAVLLGPWWATIIAAVIAVLRNVMGVGTLLAFPGGMIGALLAGWCYRQWRHLYWAAAGEVIGTGLLAPVFSAALVAPVLMGKAIPLLALLPSFLLSTLAGAILGVLALRLLERAELIDLQGSLS